MAISKAQQQAVNRYTAKNYDKVLLTMPKGKKEVIQTAAAAIGSSVNSFINAAIDAAIQEMGAGEHE